MFARGRAVSILTSGQPVFKTIIFFTRLLKTGQKSLPVRAVSCIPARARAGSRFFHSNESRVSPWQVNRTPSSSPISTPQEVVRSG